MRTHYSNFFYFTISHSILYYSADDVSKFQYLIRMQSSSNSNSKNKKSNANDKDDDKQCQRKLDGLEQMVQYCTQPACRRNALIRHFGGTAVECQKTCDFCRNPKRVERRIQSAMVVRDVLGNRNKSRHIFTGSNTNRNNKNDHGLLVDDEDEEFDHRDWGDGMVGELRVTDAAPSSHAYSSSAAAAAAALRKPSSFGGGFVRASSILDRYEKMESRSDTTRRGGDFNSNEEDLQQRPSTRVQIPEHFRTAVVPNNKPVAKKPRAPTSRDHAQTAEQLRRELDVLNAERERRMKALLEKRTKKS
jgi:superfamily II DNA helicase RecQ